MLEKKGERKKLIEKKTNKFKERKKERKKFQNVGK